MELTPRPSPAAESDAAAPATVPFDVLRAMIAARQAATVTGRMMRAQPRPVAPTAAGRVELFARGAAASGVRGAFAGDELPLEQDERHA